MSSTSYFVGRTGHGKLPLLLVHGFPLDHTMWTSQIDSLGDVASCVAALDLPGFGRTAAVSNGTVPTTMEDFADRVIACADALGFAQFVLGGHSMGGYVSLALARRAPRRLAGLVLCDTRADADTEEGRQGRIRTAGHVRENGTAALAEDFPAKILSKRTLTERPQVQPLVASVIRAASPAGTAAALLGMAARRDARADLLGLSVSTLVLVGEDDAISPPKVAKEMVDALPRAELVVIPRAGHVAPLEAPDDTNQAIRAFLIKLSQLT